MRGLLFCILALALLASLPEAHAGDWKLYTGAWSKHFNNPPKNASFKKFESDHRLLAVQYKWAQVGYMRNSYRDDTYFIGGALERPVAKHLSLVGATGANYGYTDCRKGITDNPEKREQERVCAYLFGGAFYTKYVAQPGLVVSPTFAAFTLRWEF